MLIKLLLLALGSLLCSVSQGITEDFDGSSHEDSEFQITEQTTTYGGYTYDRYMPKVCTPMAGCMVGTLVPGFRIDYFEGFLGIPYALPPIGDLRFSHPKIFPRSWDVINATQPRQDCIQKNALIPNSPVSGSEDCLYLNVYRPLHKRQASRLPVMVYIHGGGWFTGSVHPALLGPEYFMDTEDVILVTFSYRLGVFGFLSTNDAIAPGNFGLKDQTLALKWVQKNIAYFGGNPKRVTIFGQSAGAVSAHMHMLSPLSEGLFSGVIALSGTVNVPFAIQNDSLQMARQIAELSNIDNASNLSASKLVKALRALEPEVLLDATDAMKYWDVDPLTLFRPVVEETHSNDAFFTSHPQEIFNKAAYQAVPFMIGVVPEEGAVRAVAILETEYLRKAFNEDFDYLMEKFLEFPDHFNRTHLDYCMERIIQEYFQGKHELDNRGFVDVITDRGFHHPFYKAIQIYINTTNTDKFPLSLHYFNYSGSNSYSTIYTGGGRPSIDYGVVHCDELIYLFRSPVLFPDFMPDSIDAKASTAFVEHLVDFAKHRNSAKRLECNKLNFPQNSQDTICDYVSFTNGPENTFLQKTDNHFNVRRMRLWDELLQN